MPKGPQRQRRPWKYKKNESWRGVKWSAVASTNEDGWRLTTRVQFSGSSSPQETWVYRYLTKQIAGMTLSFLFFIYQSKEQRKVAKPSRPSQSGWRNTAGPQNGSNVHFDFHSSSSTHSFVKKKYRSVQCSSLILN